MLTIVPRRATKSSIMSRGFPPRSFLTDSHCTCIRCKVKYQTQHNIRYPSAIETPP